MENSKYCSLHGVELIANTICQKCDNQKKAEEARERHKQYVIKELDETNKTPWYESEYHKRLIEKNKNYPNYLNESDKYMSVTLCHNCRFFMWHYMGYCHICGQKTGGKQKYEVLKFYEMYKDYRQGW